MIKTKRLLVFISFFMIIILAACSLSTSKNDKDTTNTSENGDFDYSSTKKTYNISFVNYDDTILQTLTVKKGELPVYSGATPFRKNDEAYIYSFERWDKDISIANDNAIYKAIFSREPINYDITYNNLNGVENTNVNIYNVESETIILKDLSKDGYIFNGWYNGNEKVEKIEKGSYGDILLEAKWTPINYTATFNIDESKVGQSTFTVEDNTISNIPSIPERVGYVGEWEKFEIQAKDITINAIYTPINFNITYSNLNGVENTNVNTYNIESETIILKDLSKDGYIFNGWYNGNEKVEKIEKGSYGDISLEAKWTPINYTATFKVDGSEVGQSTFTVEDNTISNIPSIPERVGYTGEWEEYEIQAKDLTINAIYKPKKYRIIWKNWNDDVLDTQFVDYDSYPKYDSIPVKESTPCYYYEFIGWSPSVEKVSGEAIYTATYDQKEFSEFVIKYDSNGGNGSPDNQVKLAGEDLLITNIIPYFEDHIFLGWNDIYEDKIYQAGDIFTSNMNVTLYAIWAEICTHCHGEGTVTVTENCSNGCHYINGQYYTGPYCAYCGRTYGFFTMNNYGEICENCWYNNNRVSKAQYDLCSVCHGKGTVNNVYACDDCGSLGYMTDKPVAKAIESRKIVLESVNGFEYSIDGIVFQKSPIFENLKPHTKYCFYQRRATSGNIPFGPTSAKLEVSTSDSDIYYVEYILNGGINNSDNPSSFYYGSNLNLKKPTKEKYDFVGWKYGDTIIDKLDNSINVDVVLEAIWTPHKYTISYDLDGGSFDDEVKVSVNYVTKNKVETREYSVGSKVDYWIPADKYVFLGWYTDSSCLNKFDFDSPLLNNMTLYAKYYSKDYEVNGFTKSFAEYVSYKMPYDRIYYNSLSRSYSCSSNEVYLFVLESNATINFGGKNNLGTFYVYNFTDDKTIQSRTKLAYGVTKTINITVSKNEPIIIGVYLPLNGDTDNRMCFSVNTTYSHSSSTLALDCYDCTSVPYILPILSKNGYIFNGWEYDGNIITKIDTSKACDMDLKANWSLKSCSITYELYGGTNAIKNPNTFTINDNVELKNAKKDYYTFDGWYLDSSFKKKITNINGFYDDITIYAHFIPDEFNASFEANTGYFLHSVTLVWGGSIAKEVHTYKSGDVFYPLEFNIPTRSGYLFNGWYLDSNFKTPLPENYIVNDSLSLYANWCAIKNSDAVELTSSSEIDYMCTGSKTTYNYFYVSPEHSGLTDIYYSVNGYEYNTNPYGVSISQFILEDLLNNKTILLRTTNHSSNSYKLNTGNTQVLLEAGHTYCLRLVSKGTYGDILVTIVLNSISAESNKCSVSSTMNRTEQYDGNTEYPIPYLDDYDFVGWFDTDDNQISEIWNYTTDKKFNDKWTIHKFTLNYYLDGGTNNELNPSNYTINDVSIELMDPTRDGYKFEGWYLDKNYENPINVIDCEKRLDYSLYSKWVADFFSIDYKLNGGVNNQLNPQSVERDKDISLADPVKEGYTFDGWYLESTFKTKVETIHGSERHNFTIYAKWIANHYKVTLDYEGGENCPTVKFISQGNVIKTVDLFKDSNLLYFVPEAPSDNSVFGGWYTNDKCTSLFEFDGIVNNDLVLYAKWVMIDSNDNYSALGSSYDVTISGMENKYITIVSPINQTVTITSQSELDLFGTLYDSNMNLLAESDDISDDELDFMIIFTIEAGKVYYIEYKANQALVSGDAIINISGIQYPTSKIIGDYSIVLDYLDVTYGSSYDLPKPKRNGYVFEGWYDMYDKLYDGVIWNHDGDITLYAKWNSIN